MLNAYLYPTPTALKKQLAEIERNRKLLARRSARALPAPSLHEWESGMTDAELLKAWGRLGVRNPERYIPKTPKRAKRPASRSKAVKWFQKTGKFFWFGHRGAEAVQPSEMATSHLFYALRMIWNHSVPPVFRVGKFIRYSDVSKWDLAYRSLAIDQLANAFQDRTDVDSDQQDEFNDIVLNGRVIEDIIQGAR